jgi:hypothetical protein
MFHVDVVKNDWLAGIQYPLATLKLDDDAGTVIVDAPQPERWQELADELNAQDDVGAALAQLHTKLNGSHLFATEVHRESECPFRGRPVYLHGEEASGSVSAIPA